MWDWVSLRKERWKRELLGLPACTAVRFWKTGVDEDRAGIYL